MGLGECAGFLGMMRWGRKLTFWRARQSYGGFLTTKIVETNSSVFTLGMAVAPVTDWQYYDSICESQRALFDDLARASCSSPPLASQ